MDASIVLPGWVRADAVSTNAGERTSFAPSTSRPFNASDAADVGRTTALEATGKPGTGRCRSGFRRPCRRRQGTRGHLRSIPQGRRLGPCTSREPHRLARAEALREPPRATGRRAWAEIARSAAPPQRVDDRPPVGAQGAEITAESLSR